MFYKKNLPVWERYMRVLAGAAMLAVGFTFGMEPWIKWLLVASGVSFAAMGFIGFCPLCAMAGRKIKG